MQVDCQKDECLLILFFTLPCASFTVCLFLKPVRKLPCCNTKQIVFISICMALYFGLVVVFLVLVTSAVYYKGQIKCITYKFANA